jgi:pentatricopeptide repeat protein
MLEVFSSAGGMGQRALALLRSMESDGVTPDEVSYTTVLKACKPTVEEAKAMLMGA